MNVAATLDDAAVLQLVNAGPLETPQEVADFLDGSAEDRAAIIENKRLQGLAPIVSSWDTFLSVLNVVMTVAGVVTGISGAVTGAYAVAKL